MKTITVKAVAKMCHETNRAYCAAIGDLTQVRWEEAADWQKQSAIKGVIFHLNTPDASPAASHNCWLEEKRAAGWKYGPEKNTETKEHPCFVPFEALPVEQQAKDKLFKAIVDSVREMIEPAEQPYATAV